MGHLGVATEPFRSGEGGQRSCGGAGGAGGAYEMAYKVVSTFVNLLEKHRQNQTSSLLTSASESSFRAIIVRASLCSARNSINCWPLDTMNRILNLYKRSRNEAKKHPYRSREFPHKAVKHLQHQQRAEKHRCCHSACFAYSFTHLIAPRGCEYSKGVL